MKTPIVDTPYFSVLEKEMERDLITAFVNLGFRRNDVIFKNKKHSFLWHYYMRYGQDKLLTIDVRIHSHQELQIHVSGSAFQIVAPSSSDEDALMQRNQPNPETGRDWPPPGYIGSLELYKGYVSPYRRWKMIGFLPAEFGKFAAKYIPVFGRVFHLIMILLTIPFAFLTLPIRKWAIHKEAIWLSSPVENTEGYRAKQIQVAKKQIPNMLKKLQEIADQS